MEPPWSPIQGATFENPFRRPCLFIVTNYEGYLMTYYQYYHQELSDGGNLRIYLWGLPMVATYGGYLWWLPMVATFEKSVPAPLLIYCD